MCIGYAVCLLRGHLCCAGDLLMRWSDGEYLSTWHRVRAPTSSNGIPEVSIPSAARPALKRVNA